MAPGWLLGGDRGSSSDARGPGFEPWPLHLKKIPLLYPKPSGSLELGVWSLSCIRPVEFI